MKEHLFEKALSVSTDDVEIALRNALRIEWSEFLLNPRRLRGSDFLMRWSQGVWSEKRLIEAVNASGRFYAVAYGPSSVAPENDIREFELYFERLEEAGLGDMKRPDLLIFDIEKKNAVESMIAEFGGEQNLPFVKEADLSGLLKASIVAVECENSLWVARKMPDYAAELKPMKRLNGKMGLKKSAVLPTVIIKEEDKTPLMKWQNANKVPIHVWHAFFDTAYGLSLTEAQRLLDCGLIEPTVQTFQAPGGATTKKVIYKFYYHYAYELGVSVGDPELVPDYVEDKNGHILPYVRFEGGAFRLADEAFGQLEALKR